MGNTIVATSRRLKLSSPSWQRFLLWGSFSLILALLLARRWSSLLLEAADDRFSLPSEVRYQALCPNDATPMGWEFAGPTGYVNRWNAVSLPAAAAVQNMVVTDQWWYLSSVNGGIWRAPSSVDATAADSNVHWETVLDGQQGLTCTSISALTASKHRVYAGCGGATSSEQGYDHNVLNTGDWNGVMMLVQENSDTSSRTKWTMLNAFPPNYFVTDLLEVVSDTEEVYLLVAAQSHLYNATDGGIWKILIDDDEMESPSTKPTAAHRVSWNPTFTLTQLWNGGILATHGHATATSSVTVSRNFGSTFTDFGRLPWNAGSIPFYTCAAELGNGHIVVAGLTRDPKGLPNATDSQFFLRKTTSDDDATMWTELPSQPTRMDQDSMPKDRMALLADPDVDDLLYVAGNAEALAWRVKISDSADVSWTPLWDAPDVLDGSVPHADCRNFVWDDANDRLVLVTDGGVYARLRPREMGGTWISLNGDYAGLELLSAHYDPQFDRYVMGAQDNCALYTKPNATSSDVAHGFVEGDGTTTIVDSTAGHPSRLFGTVQFLGVMGDYEKSLASGLDGEDGNTTCGGLCFLQGEDVFVQVDVEKYFPEASSFPFFDHPYTLNVQDPTRLHFWTNGTGPERPSAIYEFHIPYSVQTKGDILPPTKVIETLPGVMILYFVSGGYTAGQPDPDLLIAMSSTHLYVRMGGRHGDDTSPALMARPLPVRFAEPVTLQYDADGKRILGPLTHARTVFMSVLANDARVVVVTGWQTVKENTNNEDIFITYDAGETWKNITGNLRVSSGVSGKVRPGGVLILDLSDGGRAVLLGTSNGIMVTFLPSSNDPSQWVRLGTCEEYPIVLTADVSYEPTTDRLVAATFGRGIYVFKNAMAKLLDLRQQQDV